MNQRILILTAGSRGDVQPYVALGVGLTQAGFDVTLATDTNFADLVNRHGLTFAPLRAPFAQLAQTEAGKAALSGKKSFQLRQIMPLLRQMMDDAWAVARALQPGAVIYHPKVLAGYHIAEKLEVPGFLAMALPGYSPTQAFFNPMLGGGDRGPWLNRLSYSLFFKLALLPYRGLINRWRSEALALPSVQSEFVLRGRPIPKLYGYSPQVVPIPHDWDQSSFVTGYWFLDGAAQWQPPADLVAFLAQGASPVYLGFGSMVSQDADRITRLTLDALQQAGQRAILATGWGGLSSSSGEVPENVYVLKAAPHDWLFPHCAAVVHHGGAGTTGAGLRAGKPTLICPFIGDQPFWGQRAFELGVGPRPIPQWQLTGDALAQALRTLVADYGMQQRAANLGASIRAEQGVACAVEIVQQHRLEQS